MIGLATQAGMFAGGGGFDADAQDWFDRIVAAGSSISDGNKAEANDFIVGIKSDAGVATLALHPIKAACLLAGPDTLDGALVPLVGPAPTNFNFVGGDYSRTTGLTGNGTTKYLNTNVPSDTYPQDDIHQCGWVSVAGNSAAICGDESSSGGNPSHLFITGSRMRSGIFTAHSTSILGDTGFVGQSRSSSVNYNLRAVGITDIVEVASTGTNAQNMMIFAREAASYHSGTLSYYSLGESLDLALLDARLATYMAALT